MTDPSDPTLNPAAEFAVALVTTGEHQIGLTDVETDAGPMRVSTILDPASVIYDRPRPYETATFTGDGDWVFGLSDRYATREEAVSGHARMVTKVRGEGADDA